MEQENSFLASLKREGEITPVENEEKDTPSPSESPSENESSNEDDKNGEGDKDKDNEKESASHQADEKSTDDETKLPFHKHPRWRRMQEELNDLRSFKESIVENKKDDTQKNNTAIDPWFVELFGDNEEAWKKYSLYTEHQRERLKDDILQELSKQEEQKKNEQKKMDEWVDNEIQKLEDDPSIKSFDRNKLLKVTLEYLPTDENGNIDFRKGYDLMIKLQDTTKDANKKDKITEEKKKIADKTIGGSQRESQQPTYKTSNDLRNKSFTDLIRQNNN